MKATRKPESTKAVGYIRVSTERQADHGVSLEAQRNKIEAYASLYEIQLIDIIVDAGLSAKSLKRPGLQQALTMLKTGQANAILITKLDRLTRSVKDLGILVEEYFSSDTITLLSVNDSIDTRTAAGRLVLNVLGSVSQWEREVISERTREAMSHKRANHSRTSLHSPYGYAITSDGKSLVEDTAEQAMITCIRKAKADGLSQRAIITELSRQGFTTRKGTNFSLSQVQRIMEQAQIA